VATIGKVKTAAQMIAIPFLLYFQPLNLMGMKVDVARIGTLLLYIAAILTLVSMAYYLYAARKQLRA
jgi:phosphatidylglycerophosphate synthase